jgi:hypothetical protein
MGEEHSSSPNENGAFCFDLEGQKYKDQKALDVAGPEEVKGPRNVNRRGGVEGGMA